MNRFVVIFTAIVVFLTLPALAGIPPGMQKVEIKGAVPFVISEAFPQEPDGNFLYIPAGRLDISVRSALWLFTGESVYDETYGIEFLLYVCKRDGVVYIDVVYALTFRRDQVGQPYEPYIRYWDEEFWKSGNPSGILTPVPKEPDLEAFLPILKKKDAPRVGI